MAVEGFGGKTSRKRGEAPQPFLRVWVTDAAAVEEIPPWRHDEDDAAAAATPENTQNRGATESTDEGSVLDVLEHGDGARCSALSQEGPFSARERRDVHRVKPAGIRGAPPAERVRQARERPTWSHGFQTRGTTRWLEVERIHPRRCDGSTADPLRGRSARRGPGWPNTRDAPRRSRSPRARTAPRKGAVADGEGAAPARFWWDDPGLAAGDGCASGAQVTTTLPL